jgi:hypothetical protein
MPQLHVVYDLRISFNLDSSWMSWTLNIEFVLEILVESDFSCTGTYAIRNIISSSFRAYVERPNSISYASYTSI